MNRQTEMMPVVVKYANTSARKLQLFRTAYIGASAIAMFGWRSR
jgi:hypothetical protein